MTRLAGAAAFATGAAAVLWVGAGYLGSPLALAMTVAIAAVYVLGGLELRRFHQATEGLAQALAALPADGPGQGAGTPPEAPTLAAWLARVPGPLRNAVRARVAGERVPLPGPALTPYLVGLLVLLGMLGTFGGMVLTLKGTAQALQTTTDLPTLRAALTAPVQGLGLAFGTSVAGVAASAMLGLVATLCRRARLQAGQALDQAVATTLQVHTRAHRQALQQQATLEALQAQARVVPELVGQLHTLMAQTLQAVQAAATQTAQQGQALGQQLLAGQQAFHQQAQAGLAGLASAVERTLQAQLADALQRGGATLQPMLQASLAGMAGEAAQVHARTADAVARQVDSLLVTLGQAQAGLHTRLAEGWAAQADALLRSLAEAQGAQLAGQAAWAQQLQADQQDQARRWLAATQAEAQQRQAQQQADASRLQDERRAADLAHRTAQQEADARHLAEHRAALATQQAAQQQALEALSQRLQQAWQQAADQAQAQQQQVCDTLARTAAEIHAQAGAQASRTVQEVARLMDAAAEGPRAAAEVVGQLRQSLSDSLARDNAQLEERSRLMATLQTLLQALNQASTEQRAAIDGLLDAAARQLGEAGARFEAAVQPPAARLGEAAEQLAVGAVDVASLGEAFGAAVAQFGQTSGALGAQLQRIEVALGQSLQRSDEQLAYYVAQARELIDLSLAAQQQIVAELRQAARAAG